MEKEKKKMTESLPKSIIYPFLMYFLCIAEMGILSGFHFVFPVAGGKNGQEIGLTGSTQGYGLAQIGSQVGWQFVTMSVVIVVAVLLFTFYMGFKRCLGGGITLVVMNLLPLVGLIGATAPNWKYTLFWGYGTAHMLPFMALFGLHTPTDPMNHAGQVVFVVVFALLTAAAWVVGKLYRKSYAEKYEFDLSTPVPAV